MEQPCWYRCQVQFLAKVINGSLCLHFLLEPTVSLTFKMNLIKLKIVITFISVICLTTINAKAQDSLNKVFIDSTVVKVGNLMLDYYIIKDKGEAANKMLLSNLKKKKYYS